MDKEFNLSKRNMRYLDMWLYLEEDVKEFIKRLKDNLTGRRGINIYIGDVFDEINKLAGDKLK